MNKASLNVWKNKERNSEKLLHFDLKECDTKMTSLHTASLNLHLHLQSHMGTGRLKHALVSLALIK